MFLFLRGLGHFMIGIGLVSMIRTYDTHKIDRSLIKRKNYIFLFLWGLGHFMIGIGLVYMMRTYDAHKTDRNLTK